MMKLLSERAALDRLAKATSDLKAAIAAYETRAKSCLKCEVQGSCCVDAHFVNVRITRLEAVAIRNALEGTPAERSDAVKRRISDAIVAYGLDDDRDAGEQTFACPLFEKGIGCLVHEDAKPSPCIVHACYENKPDLPPDELLSEQETLISRLNQRSYGRRQQPLPLPVALERVLT